MGTNTRWRLKRKVLLANKQRILRMREPMLVEYQHKKRYLYKDWVNYIAIKEVNKC